MSDANDPKATVQRLFAAFNAGEAGTVRATGESFRNAWAQKYLVRDNLIVEMAEYNIQYEPRG